MEEIWKDVNGYESLYQVSSLGRVRSMDRIIIDKNGREMSYKGRLLKPYKNSGGYLQVSLYTNRIINKVFVHKLVANAFIPNDKNLPEINHINEDKTNNCVENLEWCTKKYNINYGTHNERSANSRSKPIIQLTFEGDFVNRYNSIKEAANKLNVSNGGNIGNTLKDKSYSAYDYCWCYEWEYEKYFGGKLD